MKTKPSVSWNPKRLDVKAFAQAGATLSGDTPLSQWPRLFDEVQDQEAAQLTAVSWSARAEQRAAAPGSPPTVWLHLQVKTALPLCCQRCLGPVHTPVDVDRWFRFVADEATAEQEDEASEEDVLALEPKPSLIDLIEDEVLMALPLVPMHAVCPPVDKPRPADAEAPTEERRQPFAVLGRIKRSS